jgi:hypothetical protein
VVLDPTVVHGVAATTFDLAGVLVVGSASFRSARPTGDNDESNLLAYLMSVTSRR